jgi:hypothetical protein
LDCGRVDGVGSAVLLPAPGHRQFLSVTQTKDALGDTSTGMRSVTQSTEQKLGARWRDLCVAPSPREG